MTQWEYDTILMALDGGVPALADKLGAALQNLVNERNQLAKENEELKAAKCDCSCEKTQSEAAEEAEKAVKKPIAKKVN